MGDLRKTSRELCSKCIYGSGTISSVTCDYFLDTGNRRGCPVGRCDKYKKRPKGFKKKQG